MAVYGHTMWRRVCVRVCVWARVCADGREYVRVFAHVRASGYKDKASF